MANDKNRATDVFVRDRLHGITLPVSRDILGTGTGNGASTAPLLSADGRTVAFQSFASDLVPGDYNGTRDVFVVRLTGRDDDADGMEDDWEMTYFGTLARDGAGDFDGDGASDLAEFRTGTNPTNDESILRVLTVRTTAAEGQRTNVVFWSAVAGRSYGLQTKTAIEGAWTDVPGDVIGAGTLVRKTHT